ncbi:secreted antigen 1 [Babesia divergens]|uniref:Secreted antigen 1 n=1 Tax=Babesia divergens TaxID=32595 RepID=A0AAD9LEV2_BABDI|nr:secreted antigen 1 [Babesia divergens]
MSKDHRCVDLQNADTLKDILDFLTKVDSFNSSKNHVFLMLLEEVVGYCSNTNTFYTEGSVDTSLGGTINNVCIGARTIREALLQDAQGNTGSFGNYATLTIPENGGECEKKCIKVCCDFIKKYLPPFYSVLYFLYFNVDKECNAIGGSQWKDKQVNGINDNLGLWLTQEKSSKPFTPGLVKRGFQSKELHNTNNGQKVAEQIQTILSHDFEGTLQSALFYMLFICDWHEALLGHACSFLYYFCNKLLVDVDGTYRSNLKENSAVNFDELNNACTKLKENLQPFILGVSYISTVCRKGTESMFEGIWNPSHIQKYCEWLTDKLDNIKSALEEMSSDCKNWSSGTIGLSYSAGPFRYGFVFRDNDWQDDFTTTKYTTLQSQIKDLQSSLQSLLNSLKGKDSATTGASRAAAAGASVGVLSLGGAGAGVAYGFNLFGLKDIMSGVFGAIRGLVVGL